MSRIAPSRGAHGPTTRASVDSGHAASVSYCRSGAVVAIDPRTGDRKWAFKMHDVTDAGILTTAGDLVSREQAVAALEAAHEAVTARARAAR